MDPYYYSLICVSVCSRVSVCVSATWRPPPWIPLKCNKIPHLKKTPEHLSSLSLFLLFKLSFDSRVDTNTESLDRGDATPFKIELKYWFTLALFHPTGSWAWVALFSFWLWCTQDSLVLSNRWLFINDCHSECFWLQITLLPSYLTLDVMSPDSRASPFVLPLCPSLSNMLTHTHLLHQTLSSLSTLNAQQMCYQSAEWTPAGRKSEDTWAVCWHWRWPLLLLHYGIKPWHYIRESTFI